MTNAKAKPRVPSIGWDHPAEVKRAEKYLKTLDNDYVDVVWTDSESVVETLYSYGMAEDRTWTLMLRRWPIFDREPDLREDLRRHIAKVYDETERRPGYNAVGDEFEGDGKAEFGNTGLTIRRGSDIDPKAIQWIWDERIPRGKLTLFAGFPDQGKSQVLMNIAAKITTGDEWPNGEGDAPLGVVAYLSSEDDADDTLIPRLIAAGANMENILIVESMVREVKQGKKTNRVFNIADDLAKLTVAIQTEHARGKIVRAVMLDPLNAFFGGSQKADSHNSADMRALLTPIAAWSARMQVAVCGILHFNKAENAHTLYRITGSMAVAAAARAVWYCTRDPDSDADAEQFLMIQGKHNLTRRKDGLAYKIESDDIGNGLSAPRVEWLGPTKLTPDEAFAVKRRDREAEGVNAALESLKRAFAGQNVVLTAAQLDDCRIESGVSAITFKRAKQQLGVVCVRTKKIGERPTYRLRTAADDFEDELNSNLIADDFEDADVGDFE